MKQHFKTAIQHIKRSPYQAIAAIGVSAITFFIASIFALLVLGASIILNFFESQPQVTAFFKNTATQEEILSIQAQIQSSGLAQSVRYVSQDEALSIYKQQNQNDPLLLEMVTANILPASLEIQADNFDKLKLMADLVKKEPLVEEVVFQEDIVSSLSTWVNSIRIIGIALTSVLVSLSLIIILIIIGMKISLRKDEIGILHLIGATNWYIRLPFMLEGILYGILGGVIAWIATIICLLYATPFLVSFLQGVPLFPIPYHFYLILFASQIISGLLLGLISSLFAVKRFLK